MASPEASSSPSLSEGEIVEMKESKASTAQSTVLNMGIDRRDRKKRTSDSDETSRSRSYTSERARRRPSRSRSRSPFRRQHSPRGEKRRHDDYSRDWERNDARRFKLSYDDSRQHRGSRDHDESDARPGRHDDRKSRKRNRNRDHWTRSKSRSRSRSPWTRRRQEKRLKDDSFDESSRHSSFNRKPVSEEDREVANKSNQASKLPRTDSKLAGETIRTNGHQEKELTPEPEVDEAALIEARRKRREELKAKLRSQPTPLLAQVLHVPVESNPATPAAESTPAISRSASPAVGSPKSQTDNEPRTSFTEFDLANPTHFDDEQDGPSAADYDPTADMQEDRAKHDYRMHDVSAAAYDETTESHAVLMTNAEPIDPAPKPNNDEFDMFAEDDDDDDMFAPASTKPKEKIDKPMQLDAKLLDDWDDPEGYYRIILGELLDGRYHVQATLGKGMFSAVVRAKDNKTDKLVAIKIIRNNATMKKAGMKEIEILQNLAAADPDDRRHVIRLERYFEHKSHLCMVFENLSINLREVLKKFGRDVGINLKAVRTYAHQMFLGLKLLRQCGIIHADLKPDNMLVNDGRSFLKICDLGSAGLASDSQITPYLVSRFYRAPEIMLGMEFDYGIDTWSIGCTLYELYTGKILFVGRDNNQMLRSIMECRARFPLKMLKKAQYAGNHFDPNLMFRSRETDKITGKEIVKLLNFAKPTRDLKARLLGAAKGLGETDAKELNLFVDFLDRCLTLNPEKRITPAEALNHPFINRRKN